MSLVSLLQSKSRKNDLAVAKLKNQLQKQEMFSKRKAEEVTATKKKLAEAQMRNRQVKCELEKGSKLLEIMHLLENNSKNER